MAVVAIIISGSWFLYFLISHSSFFDAFSNVIALILLHPTFCTSWCSKT